MPSPAISWAAVEAAIATWVNAATGLFVIWTGQNNPRPSDDFAQLKLLDLPLPPGQPELVSSYNPAAPSGQEIEFDWRVHGDFTVSINFFSAAVIGNTAARAVATAARNSMWLESNRAALAAVAVAVVEIGTVRNLTALIDTRYEGRAQLDVRFRACDGASETTGYIATVNVTGSPTE